MTPDQLRRIRARRHADAVVLDALVDVVGAHVLVDERLVDRLLERFVLAGVQLDKLDAVLGEAIARSEVVLDDDELVAYVSGWTLRPPAVVPTPRGHAFVDDGSGRCAARPLGGGRYPVCDQLAGNDVHRTDEDVLLEAGRLGDGL